MIEMLIDLGFVLLKVFAIIIPLMLGVAYLTYAERKLIGYMQIRVGPNRVGPKGWLQPIADALKLLMKEIVIPTNANKFLFIICLCLIMPFWNGSFWRLFLFKRSIRRNHRRISFSSHNHRL